MSFGLKWNLLQIAHTVDMTNARRRRRARRMANFMDTMGDDEFVKTFRLTKKIVCELIDELAPLLPNPKRNDSIDLKSKVLAALAFYASGSYQTIVGQMLNISQTMVSRVIHEITQALNHRNILEKYIVFPLTRESREAIKKEFYLECKIFSVIGCIDGTHVSIIRPKDHEERYFNRKHYHSLNVQIICDSDLQILNVDARHPGASHDSVIWQSHHLNSYLLQKRAEGENIFLLGDSGYPLRENLMTPLQHCIPNTPEAHYNALHVSTRNIVERCIGVLKSRFRCLLAARQLHYSPVMAGKIVNACCVLHNIARKANIEVPPLTRAEAEQERQLQIHIQATEYAVQVDSGANYEAALQDPCNRRRNKDLLRGEAVQKAVIERLWQEHNARQQ